MKIYDDLLLLLVYMSYRDFVIFLEIIQLFTYLNWVLLFCEKPL